MYGYDDGCMGRDWSNNLKVLEVGPLRFSKGDLYKTFPVVKDNYQEGDLLC